MKFTTLEWIAYILVIIGGLNWGLQGLGWNLIDNIFGAGTTVTNIIYIIVGLAAIYEIFAMRKMMKSAPMM